MQNSSSKLSSFSMPNHFENLPVEIHYNVFAYLNISEILDLRLISKRFLNLIKSYNIKELSFLKDYYYDHKENWFSTAKLIRLSVQVPYSRFHLLRRNPPTNLYNLKYLNIVDTTISLNDINKFKKLQILMIDEAVITHGNRLTLPDLKALSFGSVYVSSLKLHAANLTSLSISHTVLNKTEFKHPLSIKYLKLKKYQTKALQLINLECLELEDSRDLITNDLLKFKSLKKIRITSFISFDHFETLVGFGERNGREVSTYYRGVRLNETHNYKECRESWEEYFQMENYKDLDDDLNYFKHLIYSNMIDKFPNSHPSNFFKKYTNIQKITICSMVEDQDRLLHFIAGCQNLYYLIINFSSLDQQFYDQLATVSLLFILNITLEDDIEINFDFIMNMPYLRELETDQEVLINENLNLNDLKNLESIKFEIENHEILISKIDKDEYCVDYCENLGLSEQHFFTLNELIKDFSNLKTGKTNPVLIKFVRENLDIQSS